MATSNSLYRADSPLPRPRPELVFKIVAEGAVVFSVVDETYFGLNEVATRVWELLPPVSQSFGDLCATLAAKYQGVPRSQIEQDVSELLGELTGMGLLIAEPKPGS